MTEDILLPDLPSEDAPTLETAVSSTTGGMSEEPSQEEGTLEPQVPQVSTETISVSGTPPPSARPRYLTAAKKCPRKEFQGKAKAVAKPKEPCQKPKWLTVLQEIRRLQMSFEDILPFAPFSRLVRELCQNLIEMRFTKEAKSCSNSFAL